MTPEGRALEILGQMDITPGRGRQREDNWIAIISDAIRAAQVEQRRKDVELVRDYASRRLYLNAAEMINDIADAILAQGDE